MHDLIYSIIKYTKPNSKERKEHINNLSKYYSKNDLFKTSKQLEDKNNYIDKLTAFKIHTRKDVSELKKIIEFLEGL